MVRTWILCQFAVIGFVINNNMLVDAWDLLNIFHQVPSSPEVCYKHYGCFSVEKPFTNSRNALPDTPKNMGVRFLLYTRQNPKKPKRIKHCEKTTSLLQTPRKLKVIVHGYHDRGRKKWVREMTEEILKYENANVLVVDWKRGATVLNYLQAVANTRLVAAITARLLSDSVINRYDLPASMIHIIGHSLGAHIAGYIGTAIPGIGRITGLDPAGPAFENTDPEVRLDQSDADFVDVIHTDADSLLNSDLQPGFGTRQQMGTIDFYPNGGSNQPGCAKSLQEQFKFLFVGTMDVVTNMACNHLRALDLFTESINSQCQFLSYPCKMNDLDINTCNTCGTRGCTRMGYHASKKDNHSGIYMLQTTSNPKYCLL